MESRLDECDSAITRKAYKDVHSNAGPDVFTKTSIARLWNAVGPIKHNLTWRLLNENYPAR